VEGRSIKIMRRERIWTRGQRSRKRIREYKIIVTVSRKVADGLDTSWTTPWCET
jgi:hypothetical protein